MYFMDKKEQPKKPIEQKEEPKVVPPHSLVK